jgi:K+-sensing histidine kinase KdpD
VDEALFEMAIIELIDNAVTHSDSEPAVAVDVEAAEEAVHVHVADNCPLIPAEEKEILASRLETDLQHGRGLGLWLVKWTVSLSSGDLTFAEREPRGNIVTLSLPTADENPCSAAN